MNLPSKTALEDSEAQLQHAATKLGPLIEMLQLRTESQPADPVQWPRYEADRALLSAMGHYFVAVDNLAQTHGQQVREMRKEMSAAQMRYTQMGIERDYYKTELQQANKRYYANLDLFTTLQTTLQNRLPNATA
ncbi:hypothetical protein [Hymenobacter negativus]|uniref:Uncharacterized protein n=1 Tax=Hymenobacter negativus TaxID=2795026 RepID=A0ABS3QDX7_9BACT|nr:hypothetical protein [Hymenobacter negativus]MBO2009203.1 hypothetical protein [Hymenobacter negativus]